MSNKVAFGRCEKWRKLEFVKSAKIRKKYEDANGLAIGKYWQMMACLCGADIVPCLAFAVGCPFVPWVWGSWLVGRLFRVVLGFRAFGVAFGRSWDAVRIVARFWGAWRCGARYLKADAGRKRSPREIGRRGQAVRGSGAKLCACHK
jgi:hypothetical protein